MRFLSVLKSFSTPAAKNQPGAPSGLEPSTADAIPPEAISGLDLFDLGLPLPLWAAAVLLIIPIGWYFGQRKQMERQIRAKRWDGRTPTTTLKEYFRFWSKGDKKCFAIKNLKIKVGQLLWGTAAITYVLAWILPSLDVWLVGISVACLLTQVGRASADSKAQKATTARLYEVCSANLSWGRQVTAENASSYISVDEWDGSNPAAVTIRISAKDAGKKDGDRARFAAAFSSIMEGDKRWVFDWDNTQMTITGVAEDPLPAARQKHVNQMFSVCKASLSWSMDTTIEAVDMYVDVVAWDDNDNPTEVYIKIDPKDAKKSPNERARFAYMFTQSMQGTSKWVFDWDLVNLHIRGVAVEPLSPEREAIVIKMFNICKANLSWDNDTTFECMDAYIKVNKWAGNEPAEFEITISARDAKKKEADRANFERMFSLAMSQDRRYVFEWFPNESRILGTPTPPLPKLASLPAYDNRPWNQFPIGIGAGGKEIIWDVSLAPHSLIVGKTGGGKMTSVNTMIPTPFGWTTMGEIVVGDTVLDVDGKPTRVTWVGDIDNNPDLYAVEFSDGSIIEADADHLWWTETRQARESQWQADIYKDTVKRDGVVSAEGLARVQTLLDDCSDSDEVTIREVAAAAGINPETGWVYDIANSFGPVGEIQLQMAFDYKAQEITSLQKTTLFNAREAWDAIVARPDSRHNEAWGHLKPEVALLSRNSAVAADVTLAEIAGTLGLASRGNAASLMKTLKVKSWVEKRPTLQIHSAKTVIRPGAIVRTFNAKLMYAAVLEHGAKPWHDQRANRTFGSVKTTREIMDTLLSQSGHTNHSVPVAKPLDLPEVELGIDPYVLGCWLGDGYSRSGNLCGMDHEIVRNIEARGYPTREIPSGSNIEGKHPDYRVWDITGLRVQLKSAGLLQKDTPHGSQKRIPVEYLRASVAQRRDLLAGLLDTDGTVAPQGSCQFTNVNEVLARQVWELAISLGYRATIRSNIKHSQNGTPCLAWTISFTTDVSPFQLTRKTVTHTERNINHTEQRNNTRFIVSVTPVPSQPARCIAVDSPRRLFLAGEAMIPTHNSVIQRNILVHSLSQPDEWQVALIDPKRVELGGYKVLSTKDGQGGVISIALTLGEQVDLLERVEAEMMRRYDSMEAVGINNAQNYIDPTTGRSPKAILLMVDEAFQLLAPESGSSDQIKENNELHGRASVSMGSIARLGRAAKVHMVVATQRPDAKVLGGELKANLDCRIGCGTMDTIPSLMCFDDDSGTFTTPVKGRAMIRQGGIPVEFQGYFFDSDNNDVNAHIRRGMVMRGQNLNELFPRLYTGEDGAPGFPLETRDALLAEFDVPWENPYVDGIEVEDVTFNDVFARPTQRDADFSRPNRTNKLDETAEEKKRRLKSGGKSEGVLKRMYGKDYGS